MFKTVYFLSGGVQSLKHKTHFFLSETIKKYIFILDTYRQNRKLKQQILNLQAKQSLFNELKEENKRLNKMIRFRQAKDLKLLPARIADYDLLFQNQMLVINRGFVHGVKKYMGVIHPDGVVGHVFRVSSHSSQVLTLMNRMSALPVLNQRSRVKGLIEPADQNLLLFKYFEETQSPLKPGDKIVTAQSRHFPSGFPVGRLLDRKTPSKELQSNPFVQPAVLFSSIEEVFVILSTAQNQEEDSEKETP